MRVELRVENPSVRRHHGPRVVCGWHAVRMRRSENDWSFIVCAMENEHETGVCRVILVLALLLALSGAMHVSAALLDPTTIPKWENTITGPPPVYDETSKNYYVVNVSQFNQTILPPSMGLQTTVYGYGGLAKDAVTGKKLGYIRNSPGPSFEVKKGVADQGEVDQRPDAVAHVRHRPHDHVGQPEQHGDALVPLPGVPAGVPDGTEPDPHLRPRPRR